MKAYISFILLFACALCASKKTDKHLDPNFRNEIRAKMINCISAADGVSEVLKEHLEKIKSSDERIPLHFSKLELGDSDREIIRTCKRQVFKDRRKKINEEEAPTL